MSKSALLIIISILLILSFAFISNSTESKSSLDNSIDTTGFAKSAIDYKNYCSGCHGIQLESFNDRDWMHGNSKESIIKTIKYGYPDAGMVSFDETFSDSEINSMANYILQSIKSNEKYKFKDELDISTPIKTEEYSIKLEVVKDGLNSPWGMAFLPNYDILITDKTGKLYLINNKQQTIEISGLPNIKVKGQGGLMDIKLHPKYESNHFIYITYSKPKIDNENLSTTAVMRAKLINNKLVEKKEIFEALPYLPTNHHYGSRLAFDKNGYLYISVGDRGRRDSNPQYLDNYCGKIHRVKDDGSIPNDNPFVNTKDAVPSIYSYGHRNPQGLINDPVTGLIWSHEHGPKGGDELNIIEKGKNYGWPVISYGINYNGTSFTDIQKKDGMEQPVSYWVPSIAPCGMTYVNSNKYKKWEGNILVGSLKFKYLNRCVVKNNKVIHQEILLKNIGRLRNVEVGNDGYIYIAVEGPGVLYRLIPVTK